MFKNLTMYRIVDLEGAEEMPELTLLERLPEFRFTGRPKNVSQAYGFVTPMEWLRQTQPRNAPLMHHAMATSLVAMQANTVLLPSSVVNAALRDRLHEYRLRMGHNPGKRARNQLKEDVLEELMLTAFERETVVRALILWDRGLVLMDSSSAKTCELLEDLLGKCGLDLQPYASSTIRGVLTDLAKSQVPNPPFVFGNNFHLTNPLDRSVAIRAAQHCLDDDLLSHISNGMQVEAAEMIFDDRIQFRLDAYSLVRGIKFKIKPQRTDAEGPDDLMAELDAQVFLYSAEFRALISALTTEFALS